MATTYDDPRVPGEHVREIQGEGGTVTLVGVVHDHPASTYRARTVTRAADPDVLALELPPLALPLFRAYAEEVRVPPSSGGEMSAAIQAATTDRVVGIDGPSRGFFRALIRSMYRQRVTVGTARRVCADLLAAVKVAIVSRLAGSIMSTTPVRLDIGKTHEYDVDWADQPGEQAVNERTHLGRALVASRSLIAPEGTQIREAAREAYMAAMLDTLGSQGDVVAIVGRSHLDPVADRLVGR